MVIIILLRHGENEWVKEHKLAGWIPGVHLNENGRQQAKDAAERLAHLPITTLYSSPVERCMETAQVLATKIGLEIVELPEVGEVRYGDWEGKKIEDLAKLPEWHVVQHAPSRHAFPGGESMRAVQTRMVDALESLAEKHGDEMIVVCAHADLIKMALAHYLGTHLDLFQRIVISPCSASVIMLGEKGLIRVLRVNDHGPIPKPPEKKEKKAAS
ncbi:MAG: putative phosphomutase (TIGR03848 family) [Candidatus Promineifilaceae bacterium]|jgi:probable phosphomutase (TIGR03848 family)